MKKIIIVLLAFIPGIIFSQDANTSEPTVKPSFGFEEVLLFSTLVLIGLSLFFIIYQTAVIKSQIRLLQRRRELNDHTAVLDEPSFFEGIAKRFIGLKPIEMEGELIMEDHEYDGIVELKNGMPPWLQAFFGVTILFAVSYITYYYVLNIGKDQYQEYQMQIDKANKEKEERNKIYANSINEENVTLSVEQSDLDKGKQIFIDNCATCHKANAGGDSGPNLTDEYWIHGGGIKNIFKTIKNGYIEKGMPDWQTKLNPLQIQQVSSYIISLKGSNPEGAKSPQGEIWVDNGVANDSVSVKTDSLSIDSLPKDKGIN